jgi:hypothetical protein
VEKHSILAPLFKKIDKVFFGFEELNEMDNKQEAIDTDNDEEFVVERSSN